MCNIIIKRNAMNRPISFLNLDVESAQKYVKDISNVLAEYSWIYSVKNTEVLMYNVLEKIPVEWVDSVLDLNISEFQQLPFGYIKENWPVSLQTFITESTKLAKLRFPKSVDFSQKNDKQELFIKKNVPLKKRNEISAISNIIYKVCSDMKCNKVLDIGSGLGYIDQLLHHSFGIQCIGFDSREKITEGAKLRLKGDPCFQSMQHETLLIQNTKNCIEKLEIILKSQDKTPSCDCIPNIQDAIKSRSYIMTGLHCCGNLMQDMMKLFCHMTEIKAFVCVGCCYNKINIEDFPMSQATQTAINLVCKVYPEWYPCVYGLRLGSHATRASLKNLTSEELLNQEKNLFYRAVLQYYIMTENISWKKPKRRIRSQNLITFEKYCNSMFQFQEQTLLSAEKRKRMEKLNHIYSNKKELFPRVRVLLMLQMLLQPLWECLVILDRVLYFNEKSFITEVHAAWDDAISPRNIVLCAYKV